MLIERDWLHRSERDPVSLIHVPADPAPWQTPIEPRVLVLHYAVTGNIDATVAAQRHRAFWAHASIDGFVQGRKGAVWQVRQHLGFRTRGRHAGASRWNGLDSVNGFGVGLEIANPGPLVLRGDEFFTTYGARWPADDVVELRHRNPACRYRYWANYSDQEIDIVVEAANLMIEAYDLQDIVGHEEISPGRKIDPGPALPVEWLRERFYGRAHMLGA